MRLLFLTAALVVAAPTLAQEAVSDSACTYETCALRIDQTLLGPRLVRGESPVAHGGFLNLGPPPIESAVSESPAALAHAQSYSRDLRTSSWIVYGASALYVLGALDPFDVFGGDVELGAAVGAAGLAVVSLPISLRARRSLNRAVETYNGELER